MAPPPPCCPSSLPALMEELVEEILLRILPDEPAHLFRAALVCKTWRCILSDPGFLRRYRTFHRAPPLLGYFYVLGNGIPGRSEPADFPLSPPLILDSSGVNWTFVVYDCRHGRVLIKAAGGRLIVLDPITGDQKKLSVPNHLHLPGYGAGAVLCAVDGCGHLDCHAGPFFVVYCMSGTSLANKWETWATMYSSETREWSALISIDVDHCVDSRHTLLVRNNLYFSLDNGIKMLKYDLIRHELSVMISSPSVRWAIAMELDDGGLGFVAMLDRCIYMWSWQADANNGIGKWAEHMVMQLETQLTKSKPHYYYRVVGFMEGTNTIFISAYAGLFTLDLKSKKVKKIGKRGDYYRVIPYMSFYTRDLANGGLSL